MMEFINAAYKVPLSLLLGFLTIESLVEYQETDLVHENFPFICLDILLVSV